MVPNNSLLMLLIFGIVYFLIVSFGSSGVQILTVQDLSPCTGLLFLCSGCWLLYRQDRIVFVGS